MFSRFFSSDHRRASVSVSPNCSTNTLSKEKIIPGGPSPDSSSSPHNARHHAATSRVAADPCAHHQTRRTFENVDGLAEGQPQVDAARTPTPQRTAQSELYPATAVAVDAKPTLENVGSRSTSHSRGQFSDAHLENAPIAAASEVADERRSASVASRRTNRSKTIGNMSGSAFAHGAATTANEPSDVDQSLYVRAASAEEELRPREKAAIRKEERMFFFSYYNIISSIRGLC
jgi:hypothetical protein